MSAVLAALETAETLFEFEVLVEEHLARGEISDEELARSEERELELRQRAEQQPDAELEAELRHLAETKPRLFKREVVPMLRKAHALAVLNSHRGDPRVRALVKAEFARRSLSARLPRRAPAGGCRRHSSRRRGSRACRSPGRTRPSDDEPPCSRVASEAVA